MNEAQFLLSLGFKARVEDDTNKLACPPIIRPSPAMVENGDPEGLVMARDRNNDPVPNSRRRKQWV